MTESGNTKTILIVLGALVALWGILTILDIGKRPYAGYNTDGNNTVTRVNAGGPAETAGLQAGDFIENINGISTENSAELIDLGRAAPGETRNFAVRRDGEQVQLDITYASLDTRNRNLSWAGTLIGFCYLGFCLAALMSGQNRATGVLAIMGIGIGLAFLSGPYFESAGLRSVINTLRNALVLTGIAGPEGGTEDKPVGTVFIGLADDAGTIVRRHQLAFDRRRNKQLSSQIALDWVRRRLLGLEIGTARLPQLGQRS